VNPIAPIRVLVVDDSPVARMAISQALAGEPGLEVVALAGDGWAAMNALDQVRPDLVVLDVEMPQLDGLETLVRLRARFPSLPVIMFSALTHRGATATLEALFRGANDWVAKPSAEQGAGEMIARIREELVPRIRALCAAPPGEEAAPARVLTHASRAVPVELIVIAASAGGPIALAQVLQTLPRDLEVPVLIVQHMPPIFTRVLAERLDSVSAVRVAEGGSHAALLPGSAWLAPGGFHMEVVRGPLGTGLRLNQDPPIHSCRPAADVLFRTAATVFGAGVLAAVLTGMGQDGLEGARAIRASGGRVIAQDQATSAVWGMPGAVVRAGLVDDVLPVGQIGAALADAVRIPRPARAAGG